MNQRQFEDAIKRIETRLSPNGEGYHLRFTLPNNNTVEGAWGWTNPAYPHHGGIYVERTDKPDRPRAYFPLHMVVMIEEIEE